MALPIGQQGSWFAAWQGEQLPCVHKHYVTAWPSYHDPIPGVPLPADYVAAIKRGRVILTRSNVDGAGQLHGRKYVGVFRVEDVQFSPIDGLRFRFAGREAAFGQTAI